MSTFWPRFSTVIVLSKRSFIGEFTLVLWRKLKHWFREGIRSKRPLPYYGFSLSSPFSFPKTVVILPARPTSRHWVYNELWCLSAAGSSQTSEYLTFIPSSQKCAINADHRKTKLKCSNRSTYAKEGSLHNSLSPSHGWYEVCVIKASRISSSNLG